jgi:hypothetical protein
VKCTRPEKFHVTHRFLGTAVDPLNIEPLAERLHAISLNMPP